MVRNQRPKKRSKFEREMDKRVDARMKELYLDKDFRLKLEAEAKELKTIEDIAEYNMQAAENSRKEVEAK